jgi:hypothetical protein
MAAHASTKEYTVNPRPISSGRIPNAVAICGSDVVMMVVSSNSTKNAVDITKGMVRRAPGSRMEGTQIPGH